MQKVTLNFNSLLGVQCWICGAPPMRCSRDPHAATVNIAWASRLEGENMSSGPRAEIIACDGCLRLWPYIDSGFDKARLPERAYVQFNGDHYFIGFYQNIAWARRWEVCSEVYRFSCSVGGWPLAS